MIAHFSEFRDQIMADMISQGVSKALAETFATSAAKAAFKIWAGKQVYFAKGRDRRVDPDLIWQEFTGRNQEALATRHKCTVRRVEQIIAERTAALKPKGVQE